MTGRKPGFFRRALLASALVAAVATASPALAANKPQIIGGGDAAPGAYPYAVYVEAGDTAGGFSCTGSLIAPTLVLTAGHCAFDETSGQVLPPSVYTLTLGLTDLTSPPAGNHRSVSAVLPYPYDNQATLQGDAAILVLSQPAPSGAAPIAVASTADAALYAAGLPATILGWGVTSSGPDAQSPDILQTAGVSVQSNATCSAAGARSFHPGFDLCTAAPGFSPSTCNGDSGSPLVESTASGPVEIGITSYGIGTCATSPDYFVRVSSIQSWIASVIAGTPAPSVFVPQFVAPVPAAALNRDGVTVSFAPPLADPATLASGYAVTLLDSTGKAITSQNLAADATSATFAGLQPGTYSALVAALYTEGSSVADVSTAVTLEPPANTRKPKLKGRAVPGSTLACHGGAWAWPGTSTLVFAWLRNGQSTGRTAKTYKLNGSDAGKKIACAVTLKASTGAKASASSSAVRIGVKLRSAKPPRIVGSASLGSKLTCLAGTWQHSGALELSYRWRRGVTPIVGKRGATSRLTVTAADVGRKLSCRVTAATAGQSAAAVTRTVTVSAG
jgi:trypsin